MGLAGAFVVLPADGTAYGSQPTGYPSTAYDDEAVLVLSEIDPVLNNNVSHSHDVTPPAPFDMRDFNPRYRLINGKAFPETDPVSTDQDHQVLLRYVNVGSQSHSMTSWAATRSRWRRTATPGSSPPPPSPSRWRPARRPTRSCTCRPAPRPSWHSSRRPGG